MPYQGSKNSIAKEIINLLPSAKHLYDLFGGGGAISHCASESGKWEQVHYNELNPVIAKGFTMAINGEFANEKRWISRDEFLELKGIDPYATLCFSFGASGNTYCYSRELEPLKKAYHYAVVYGEYIDNPLGVDLSLIGNVKGWRERRLAIRYIIMKKYEQEGLLKRKGGHWHLNGDIISTLERLQDLRGLIRLEQLQSISQANNLDQVQHLERMERLVEMKNSEPMMTSNLSYEQVNIQPNSTIYCDIPYKNTGCGHYEGFNHDKFYNWALSQNQPVFISEYSMPDDFVEVWQRKKTSRFASGTSTKRTLEKIFIPRHQQKDLPKLELF